ncbi:hypothetical protein [Halomonas sp. H5]
MYIMIGLRLDPPRYAPYTSGQHEYRRYLNSDTHPRDARVA